MNAKFQGVPRAGPAYLRSAHSSTDLQLGDLSKSHLSISGAAVPEIPKIKEHHG